ncbi:MazG nucleotide pyrophosphohydrolase domain-containing protein [Clostridiaceae bacterium M8S5]|nr:MazG nucleotide pyrophosphohydrolase domain-containing protein [Clostridiaceae bacterium M8S5]
MNIEEMLNLSKLLWESNKERWSPMEPEYSKDFLLYMVEELGEVIAIIKKKGINSIMENEEIRERFIEEMGDVMMYYMDVLNRFKVTSEEFTKVYKDKYDKNLIRNYKEEYEKYQI